jgi:CubicO group peptidase (beta-lactamase class C family)
MKRLLMSSLCGVICFSVIAQVNTLQPGSPLSVKVSPERLKKIDQLFQGQIESGQIKGAVAFVSRNGKVVYNKAFGIDDDSLNTPMKTDAIFRIASQTKAITSVAVMILFEEGKFFLDDPVSKYIPAFGDLQVVDKFNNKDTSYTTKPANRLVTIRDLLTHTSGIGYPLIGNDTMRAIYAKAEIPLGMVSDALLLKDGMSKLAKQPLAHQPGERYTYGLNTDVLGYLVEVVSKMSLEEFLKERLFKPLGMDDTYFYLPPSKYPRLMTIYITDENNRLRKWKNGDWPFLDLNYPKARGTYFSGGAGLCSTIKDYAIFLQMLLNGGQYKGTRILSRHTVEMMTSNQIGNIQWIDERFYSDRFGLGFAVTTQSGQARLGQSEGSFEWAGAINTFYWVDPKEKLVCLLFMQQIPFSWSWSDKFKVAVYQALDD